MAYNFSKGSTVQGDIKAADDTQRDTKIDFEEDYIGFETGGSPRLVVSGSKVGVDIGSPSHKLDVNGDIRVRGNDIRDNSGNPAISFDGSSNTSIAGNLSTNGGYIAQLDVVSSSPFTVTSAHHYLSVDTSSARTINLPSISSGDVGRILTIFDSVGRANINNITISAAGGTSINGDSSYAINTVGGTVTIICVSSTLWIIINKVT